MSFTPDADLFWECRLTPGIGIEVRVIASPAGCPPTVTTPLLVADWVRMPVLGHVWVSPSLVSLEFDFGLLGHHVASLFDESLNIDGIEHAFIEYRHFRHFLRHGRLGQQFPPYATGVTSLLYRSSSLG